WTSGLTTTARAANPLGSEKESESFASRAAKLSWDHATLLEQAAATLTSQLIRFMRTNLRIGKRPCCHTLRRSSSGVMLVARPENGPRLRPDASAPTPLRSRQAVLNPGPNVTIHSEDHPMLGLHSLSRQAVRLGIAVGGLAAAAAYGGNAADYGTSTDFMVGKRIGGTNVFGGGVPLYNSKGTLVGGLGVSGDASCADHNIAWKMRHALELDYVPKGVADGGKDDNII